MKWLDRTILVGPELCIVTSSDDYRRALKSKKLVDHDDWIMGCNSLLHTFVTGGNVCCILAIDDERINGDEEDLMGLLCHESVHIWQRLVAATDVDKSGEAWGTEAQAYGIENIFTHLMREAKRLRGAK